jgi:hypothetical protein
MKYGDAIRKWLGLNPTKAGDIFLYLGLALVCMMVAILVGIVDTQKGWEGATVMIQIVLSSTALFSFLGLFFMLRRWGK